MKSYSIFFFFKFSQVSIEGERRLEGHKNIPESSHDQFSRFLWSGASAGLAALLTLQGPHPAACQPGLAHPATEGPRQQKASPVGERFQASVCITFVLVA